MKHNKCVAYAFYFVSALALLVAPLGCGEYPGLYQGETLTFETPVSSKTDKRGIDAKVSELDLSEDEVSDFHFGRIAAPWIPWGPFPVYDYYLEPIPVEVPVSPFYSVIDFIHPFYAVAFDFWSFDDDDGHRHRRKHHRDDD